MTSCVGKKKFDEMVLEKNQEVAEMQSSMEKLQMDMQTQIDELDKKNADLASEKNTINKDLASVKTELSTTKKDLSDVEYKVDQKQKQIDNLRGEINAAFANVEAAVSSVDQAISSSSDRIKEIEGQLYLDLNDDINFKSASAKLQSGDEGAIQEIANMLISNPTLTLFVEGHADNRGIVTGKYDDNWDLSAARGISVVRKLIEFGVNPKQLAAAGRAEFLPEVQGDSKEAHTANRRTEFVIVPNVGKLYRMSKEDKP
jgi:chemotaxis protein MotB